MRIVLGALLLAHACSPAPRPAVTPAADASAAPHDRERELMVSQQLEARDVRDPRVLTAMRKVQRHLFVPPPIVGLAYADSPQPIGHDQTISQPYIVGFMTQALGLKGGERVLEVGTGSGYQAAVLAEIAKDVYTIEIVAPLAEESKARLASLGYRNVHVRAGDGYAGWPEAEPFDAIIVTAAAPRIPQPLVDQLRDGGRMVIPVGDDYQELILLEKKGASVQQRRILPVRFVPMTGAVRKP